MSHNLNSEFLAYFAGFIDSHGSLHAKLIKSSSYKWNYKIVLYLTIVQNKSKHWFLIYLQNTLKMGYIKHSHPHLSEYTIKSKKEIKDLLIILIPYLIIKKPQAKLLLEIIEKKDLMKTTQEFIEVSKLIEKFNEYK